MKNWIGLVFLGLVSSVSFVEGGCPPPQQITGGYFQPYQEDYEYGKQIHYYCESGYQTAEGTVVTRTCQGFPTINAWIWSGVKVECALVDCGVPEIPDAHFDIPEETKYRSTTYYKCADGLAPMGALLAECTANATWQYTRCQEPEFYCSKPPEVSRGRLNVSSTKQQHGTTIQYECEGGYGLQGSSGSLFCKKTNWIGTVPTCEKLVPTNSPDQPSNEKPTVFLNENALPIVAGVVTAVLLTAILIITVLCLRKRYKQPSSPHNNSESAIAAPPDAASTPRQHHHLVSTGSFKSAAGSHLMPIATDETALPYHRIQCPHMLSNPDYTKSDQNYVPDCSLSHFRLLVANSEHTHSSSPSTVQSEVSATDSEFHTIRECLGDFGNNNLPNSHSLQHSANNNIHSFPSQQQQRCHTFNPNQPNNNIFVSGTTPRTRTLWTPDGRPYEAVTCSHGVEHIYQPLEHIYEEPHTWTRPLPNPHLP